MSEEQYCRRCGDLTGDKWDMCDDCSFEEERENAEFPWECELEQDIRLKYRALLAEHDPDNGGDAEKFKQIQDEYVRIQKDNALIDRKFKFREVK